MNRRFRYLFCVSLVVLISLFFAIPHVSEASVFSKASQLTASVSSSVVGFFTGLFGKNKEVTAPENTPRPSATPLNGRTNTNPSQKGAASSPSSRLVGIKTPAIQYTVSSGVTESQLAKSLQLLEDRMRSLIASSGGGGLTVPPPVIYNLPQVQSISGSNGNFTTATAGTLTVSGATSLGNLTLTGTATTTAPNGMDIADGCFAIDGTCIQSATGLISSQWATSGSNIYFNTGNVGIGTTTPGLSLSTTGDLLVGGTGTSTFMGNAHVKGNLHIGANSLTISETDMIAAGSSYTFSTADDADHLTLQTSGRVGVATSSPWGVLSVEKNGANANMPIFVASENGVANPYLLVTHLGNVGIGTSTPSAKFGVVGNSYLNGDLYLSGSITGGTWAGSAIDASGLTNFGTPFYTFFSATNTSALADSLNKRYVTDAHLTILGNTSNTNTGDETQSTIKAKLGSASSGVDGYILGTDWDTFNNKVSSQWTTATGGINYADGNVGIDETSPSAKLTINPNSFVSDTATLNFSGITDLAIGYSNGGFGLYRPGDATRNTYFVMNDGAASMSIRSGWGLGIVSTNNASRVLFNTGYDRANGNDLLGVYISSAGTGYPVLRVKGIANQTADLLQIRKSDETQLLTVTADGNVGIGTTSPYTALGVAGQITANNIWATSTASNYFAGNVGVGTASPTAKLDVGNGYIRALDTGSITNPTSGMGIELGALSAVGYINSYDRTASAYRVLNISGSTVVINASGAGGNVGIGVTNPVTKLEVGTYNTSNSNIKTGSLEFQPYSLNNAWFGENTYYDGSSFKYRATGAAGMFYFVGSEGQFRFYTSGTAGTSLSNLGNNSQLKINADGTVAIGGTAISSVAGTYTGATLVATGAGNVGIGTTSPYTKLGVAGTIVADTIFATSTTATSTFANGIIIGSNNKTITTAGNELILQQTGDVLGGSTKLRLQNRSGSAGAIFENTALDLVDFGFVGSGNYQSNLRFEHRSSDLQDSENISGGELQFLDDALNTHGGTNFIFSFGTSSARLGAEMLKLGTPSTGTIPDSGLTVLGADDSVRSTIAMRQLNHADYGFDMYLDLDAARFDFKRVLNGSATTVWSVMRDSNLMGIGTIVPQQLLHVAGGALEVSTSGAGADSYANRASSIIFSRGDVPTSYLNKITNSYSGATTDQTMNFEIGSGASTFVTAMTLTGAGNVGIGTSNPTYKLAVSADDGGALVSGSGASSWTALVVENTNDTATQLYMRTEGSVIGANMFGVSRNNAAELFAQNNSVLSIGNLGDIPVVFGNNNLERMRIAAGGNVGIGTTSPGFKLEVTGTSRIGTATTGTTPLLTVGDGTGLAVGRILSTGANAPSLLSLFSSGSREGFLAQTSGVMYLGNTGGLANYNDATLLSNAAMMISTTNGVAFANSLAIGTTSIAADTGLMLRNKNIGIEGTTLTNGASMGELAWGPRIGISAGDYSVFPVKITGNLSDTGTWYDNASMRFFTSSGGDITNPAATTEKMRITGAGNLGVGTTSPWRTLAVTGTVGFDGLTSSATGNAVCITSNKEITDAGGAVCTGSSERFKENILTLDTGSALSELNKLRVVSFDYKKGFYSPEESAASVGLIAEEVEKIDPRLVDYGYDGKPLTLHFERITGLTVQAIQEQDIRIKALEGKLGSSTLPDINLPQEASLKDMLVSALSSSVRWVGGQLAAARAWVGELTVGTPEKPTGITLYDEVSKEPYCLKISNGTQIASKGVCGTVAQDVIPTTQPQPGTPIPPVVPPTGTSTDPIIPPTSTTTDPVVLPVSTTTPPITPPEDTPVPPPVDPAPVPPEPTPEPIIPVSEPTPTPTPAPESAPAPTPEPETPPAEI